MIGVRRAGGAAVSTYCCSPLCGEGIADSRQPATFFCSAVPYPNRNGSLTLIPDSCFLTTALRWRLSLLMFLQYAAPGAVIPLFTLRLQELGFTPLEMGWACATQALAGLVAPLVAGQAADRWLPAERCLAGCAFLAGGVLWLLGGLTTPLGVFCASLAFWLVMAPAITLGTSLSFTHLASVERDFGRIRLWGTVGWVVPIWVLSYWFTNPEWLCALVARLRPEAPYSQLADAFRLAAVLAVVQGAYALTLPHTPPLHRSRLGTKGATPPRPAFLDALRALRSRPFAVYCVVNLGVAVTLAFTGQVTPLLLKHLGIPLPWLSRALTIAQSTEIAALALLPMLLLRLDLRGTMLLGLGAWVLALGVLTLGRPVWLVVSSLALNGLCVCCFLVAGQVFVNSRARGDIRASAQALLSVVNGLGMLVGNLFVAWVRWLVEGAFPPTFAVGTSIAAVLAVIFFVGFRPREGAMLDSRRDIGKEGASAEPV